MSFARFAPLLLASALLGAQTPSPAPEAAQAAPKAAAPKAGRTRKAAPQAQVPKAPLIPVPPEFTAKQALGRPRKKAPKLPYEQRTNLNAASKEELMKLPGMSEEIAAKIIAGRPYTSKAGLVTQGGVPGALYFTLKDKVAAGPLPGQPAPGKGN